VQDISAKFTLSVNYSTLNRNSRFPTYREQHWVMYRNNFKKQKLYGKKGTPDEIEV